MNLQDLEDLLIERGIEHKVTDCQKYLDLYFIGFSDKSSIKDIRKHRVIENFEAFHLLSIYELSDFVIDTKLMIRIAQARDFDPSLIMYLNENLKGLKTLLRFIKTKTKLADLIQTSFKKWDGFRIEQYNDRVIQYFKYKS